jgi:solute carrier family 35 (GDP-fucose transporter), member C1
MISSAVRGVAASVLGVALFGDIFTLWAELSINLSVWRWHYERRGRVSAIVLILGGSICYTWVKHVESIAPPPPRQYEQVSMDELEEGVGEKSQEQVKI